MKGNILEVERINKTVLEVYVKMKGKISSFIRENKKIIRFSGPRVTENAYRQVRAIFSNNENVLPDKNEKTSEEKKKFREITRGRLTKHELQRLKTLENAGIKYCILGWVQIDHWQEMDKGLKNKPIKFIDLPTAIRRQEHILKNYKGNKNDEPGETRKIMEFYDIISRIHAFLIAWKEAGKGKRKEIELNIVRVASKLEHCSNFYKVDARDLLYDMSTLEDALGRLNPPAMAANIIPILGLLANRLEQIRAIIPKIAIQSELLKFEREVMEAERKNALIKIKSLLQKSNMDLVKEKIFIQTRIRQIIFNLYRLHPSPYFDARHYSINIMSKISFMLNTEQIAQARYYLKIVRHVLSNEI